MSMMPYFVPTRFVWRFGGKQVRSALLRAPCVARPDVCRAGEFTGGVVQVSLCGSFTRWVETVQMIPVDQSPGVFAVLVHLPAGCVPAPPAHAGQHVRCEGARGARQVRARTGSVNSRRTHVIDVQLSTAAVPQPPGLRRTRAR